MFRILGKNAYNNLYVVEIEKNDTIEIDGKTLKYLKMKMKLETKIRQIKVELLLEKAKTAELHEEMLHKEHPEYLYPTKEEEEWSSKAQQYRDEANKLKMDGKE